MTGSVSSSQISRSPVSILQAGLALVAAAILGFRTARTANGQGVPELDTTSHLLGAAAVGGTAVLAVAAAVLLLARHPRPALLALATALLMELFVLDLVAAPPRLITALPLGMALVLFLVAQPTRRATDPEAGLDDERAHATARPTRLRTAAAVVALLLMLPVGFLYLLSGLVVPAPDLFGMYALFAALLAGTGLLARRRSWLALAVPPASVGLWFLLIRLGGLYWGWQP